MVSLKILHDDCVSFPMLSECFTRLVKIKILSDFFPRVSSVDKALKRCADLIWKLVRNGCEPYFSQDSSILRLEKNLNVGLRKYSINAKLPPLLSWRKSGKRDGPRIRLQKDAPVWNSHTRGPLIQTCRAWELIYLWFLDSGFFKTNVEKKGRREKNEVVCWSFCDIRRVFFKWIK